MKMRKYVYVAIVALTAQVWAGPSIWDAKAAISYSIGYEASVDGKKITVK